MALDLAPSFQALLDAFRSAGGPLHTTGPLAAVVDCDGGAPSIDAWADDVRNAGGGHLVEGASLLAGIPWHVRAALDLEWQDETGHLDGTTLDIDVSHPWRAFLGRARLAPPGALANDPFAFVLSIHPVTGSTARCIARWPPTATRPELVYHPRSGDLVPLRLSVREYFEQVLVTRGWGGWELAFAAEPLRDPSKVDAQVLAPLRKRLGERFPELDLGALQTR